MDLLAWSLTNRAPGLVMREMAADPTVLFGKDHAALATRPTQLCDTV